MCGCCGVLQPRQTYTNEQKAQILSAYSERTSLRGLQRVFGVWRSTVLRWLERLLTELPDLPQTLLY
jgi:insertion element IS1 protein InsB